MIGKVGEKQPYILTFKRKDKRKDKTNDKTAILQQRIGSRLKFIDVGAYTAGFAPPDDPNGVIALDINDFEMPTVFAALTLKEANVLRKDPNIKSVEPDGKIYAQGFVGGLGESRITAEETSAQADVVPWGISRVRAPMCWDATRAKGIYIAVLGTGIWPHNDLTGNLLGGISFVPGESWIDGYGHGNPYGRDDRCC